MTPILVNKGKLKKSTDIYPHWDHETGWLTFIVVEGDDDAENKEAYDYAEKNKRQFIYIDSAIRYLTHKLRWVCSDIPMERSDVAYSNDVLLEIAGVMRLSEKKNNGQV